MFFRNNRISVPVRSKVSGRFRVLCIGDSLTYGHGVTTGESLPSILESELNRSLWNRRVEVINESNCGYSFYDYREVLDIRGMRHDPDLLILIICANDTELFQADDNYEDHVRMNWEEDGDIFPYFEVSFCEFCESSRSLEYQTIIAFYDQTNSEAESPYSDKLRELCHENSMRFIDISRGFKDMSNESLRVNETDGHPSPLAHKIAAKELARYLISENMVSEGEDSFYSEAELYEKIEADAEDMHLAGYPIHDVVDATRNLMGIKRNSRKRMKLSEENLLDETEFEKLTGRWESLRQKSWKLLYLEAYAASLEMNGSQFSSESKSVENEHRKAAKNLHVLRSNLKNGINRYTPYGSDDKDETSLISDLVVNAGKLEEQKAKFNDSSSRTSELKNSLEMMQKDIAEKEACKGINDELLMRITNARITIKGFFDESEMLTGSVENLISSLRCITDEIKHDELNPNAAKYLSLLSVDLIKLSELTTHCLNYLSIENTTVTDISKNCAATIKLVIKMKCKASKGGSLMVNLNAIIPHIHYYFDQVSIHLDNQMHTYYFNLPLHFLGAFRIWATGTKDLQLENVEIYLNENQKIKFNKNNISIDDKGAFNSPLVLIPL